MMVERVARAISASSSWGNYIYAFERDTLFDERAELLKVARAAIEAMKPTDAMLIAGSAAMVGPLTSSSSVWQAMIQAALEGEG